MANNDWKYCNWILQSFGSANLWSQFPMKPHKFPSLTILILCLRSVFWCCWLGGRKSTWPAEKLSDEVLAWSTGHLPGKCRWLAYGSASVVIINHFKTVTYLHQAYLSQYSWCLYQNFATMSDKTTSMKRQPESLAVAGNKKWLT